MPQMKPKETSCAIPTGEMKQVKAGAAEVVTIFTEPQVLSVEMSGELATVVISDLPFGEINTFNVGLNASDMLRNMLIME